MISQITDPYAMLNHFQHGVKNSDFQFWLIFSPILKKKNSVSASQQW